jgi:hypothetical protein
MLGKSINIFSTLNYSNSMKFFMRLNIATSTISVARAFKEFLRTLSVLLNSTASWRMPVMYISNGVMKTLGCAL